MKSNPYQAIEFLNLIHPESRWVLTAIEPDQKGIETATFGPDTADDARAWVEAQNVSRNIYYHVNPVGRDLDKKAQRADVAALAYLHVDVDPRAGEDIREEQRRAVGLLEAPPGDVPPPTAVVFSGGGYNALWRLREPMALDGDEARWEEAKRYNLQLETVFGADNCHNVDRILRLPGTVNWPDARKRKRGRVPVLAELVWWKPDRTYDLTEFQQAPPAQKGDDGFSGHHVQVSGNVARLGSVDELPDDVTDRIKMVIVQGDDPDEPYPSRSEALFAVCCALVRVGCDDDAIFSVITDPDFRISGSVLDKGSGMERYAVRQIERAREEAVDPWLRQLNEKHAVISDVGGKCRVISEVWDPAMDRFRISRQSFDDFRNRYMNQRVQVGTRADGSTPVWATVGKWWLEHPTRRQYETLVFAPGKEVPGAYNLWRGFACDPKPDGDFGLFVDHILDNVCGGAPDYFDYLIRWMARAVQEPDSPGYTAVVLRGKQGTGKSFFAKQFGALWGRHFLQVSDPKHLVGSFNSHLRDCVVLFADEAFYAGDKKHASILKSLITEEMIAIEAKGVDVEVSRNCVHLIMASNEDWVVNAELDDRRFFVLDVSGARAKDGEYFAQIEAQMNAGGHEALLHHLMTFDLDGFDVRAVPKTEALVRQKVLSRRPEEDWWLQKLMDGYLLPADGEWTGEVVRHSLMVDFVNGTRHVTPGVNRFGTAAKLGHFLKKVCPDGWPKNRQSSKAVRVVDLDGREIQIRRPYYWAFPGAEECRAYWEQQNGPQDWPSAETTAGRPEHEEF